MNLREFRIRLTHWEYWPFEIVYLPIFIYWIWLSIKARSLLYFTAANTLMKNGGMLGESKMDIFNRLPDNYIPFTLYISPGTSNREILQRMGSENMDFPVIMKPDVGERGQAVRKINSIRELCDYNSRADYAFLIQSFIPLPLELGVFYYRFPETQKGRISSVVYKEMLAVTGDGHKTLAELIAEKDRAFLQRKVLKNRFKSEWHSTPANGCKIILENIGNHSRGTKFLDGSTHITEAHHHIFDQLADELEGFYFGRFDVRTASWEEFQKGNFVILELNGAGAEPAHIYDPAVSFRNAYRSLLHHWKVLYLISRQNHTRGIPYLTLREGLNEYRAVLQNKKRTARQ